MSGVIPRQGARRRRSAVRGTLVAAVGAAVIAGSGAVAVAAESPVPAPGRRPGVSAGRRGGPEPAVAYALRHVGDPYQYGGRGPRRWDCSGLVQQSYRRAGVRLPRLAADQYRATRRVPRAQLRRGDLLFWSGNGRASGVHHVAIYLGGRRYVEAAHAGTKVRVSSFAKHNARMFGRVARPGRR
ncbi:hypothetical protein BLA24_19925 [Streptomyces cinnamoneus]|uniref:NlpC/P60 domain-containing protein n=1 Tax=Streptomyces cinnamoneus TaxID=53446 RepID=A0A2G1XF93_STRCJ|nr:C40 family peptidase [Streptomyces cinnamoneus]PHQ49903.1 hypothetical protein BLA24_19925 [Streptomyces cinnamoneus]PPT13321.1 NlpC/P60 family protein [Streptomyces cinnamoneus]